MVLTRKQDTDIEIDDMREYISELFEGNKEAQSRIPSDRLMELSRKIHCTNASDYEFAQYMYYCVKYNLDPLLGYVEFVKYDKSGVKPAQIFIGKRGMMTIAARNPNFVGAVPGIHFKNPNSIVAMNTPAEAGQPATFTKVNLGTDKKPEMYGHCVVYRKDRDVPIYVEIKTKEYNTGNSTWSSKSETMSKKVALTQALELAFPEDYANGYSPEEFGLSSDIMRKSPEYITEAVKSVYSSYPSIALPNGVLKPSRVSTDDIESEMINGKSESVSEKSNGDYDVSVPVPVPTGKSDIIESVNDIDEDSNNYYSDDNDLSNDNASDDFEDADNMQIIDEIDRRSNVLESMKNKNIIPSIKTQKTTPSTEEFSLF